MAYYQNSVDRIARKFGVKLQFPVKPRRAPDSVFDASNAPPKLFQSEEQAANATRPGSRQRPDSAHSRRPVSAGGGRRLRSATDTPRSDDASSRASPSLDEAWDHVSEEADSQAGRHGLDPTAEEVELQAKASIGYFETSVKMALADAMFSRPDEVLVGSRLKSEINMLWPQGASGKQAESEAERRERIPNELEPFGDAVRKKWGAFIRTRCFAALRTLKDSVHRWIEDLAKSTMGKTYQGYTMSSSADGSGDGETLLAMAKLEEFMMDTMNKVVVPELAAVADKSSRETVAAMRWFYKENEHNGAAVLQDKLNWNKKYYASELQRLRAVFNTKIAEVNAHNKKLSLSLQMTRATLDSLRKKVWCPTEADHINRGIEEAVDGGSKFVKELSLKHADALAALKPLEARVAELQAEVKDLRELLASKPTEVAPVERRRSSIAREEAERAALHAQMQHLQAAHAALQSASDARERELLAEIEHLKGDLRKQVRRSNKASAALRDIRAEARKELARSQANAAAAQEAVAELQRLQQTLPPQYAGGIKLPALPDGLLSARGRAESSDLSDPDGASEDEVLRSARRISSGHRLSRVSRKDSRESINTPRRGTTPREPLPGKEAAVAQGAAADDDSSDVGEEPATRRQRLSSARPTSAGAQSLGAAARGLVSVQGRQFVTGEPNLSSFPAVACSCSVEVAGSRAIAEGTDPTTGRPLHHLRCALYTGTRVTQDDRAVVTVTPVSNGSREIAMTDGIASVSNPGPTPSDMYRVYQAGGSSASSLFMFNISQATHKQVARGESRLVLPTAARDVDKAATAARPMSASAALLRKSGGRRGPESGVELASSLVRPRTPIDAVSATKRLSLDASESAPDLSRSIGSRASPLRGAHQKGGVLGGPATAVGAGTVSLTPNGSGARTRERQHAVPRLRVGASASAGHLARGLAMSGKPRRQSSGAQREQPMVSTGGLASTGGRGSSDDVAPLGSVIVTGSGEVLPQVEPVIAHSSFAPSPPNVFDATGRLSHATRKEWREPGLKSRRPPHDPAVRHFGNSMRLSARR